MNLYKTAKKVQCYLCSVLEKLSLKAIVRNTFEIRIKSGYHQEKHQDKDTTMVNFSSTTEKDILSNYHLFRYRCFIPYYIKIKKRSVLCKIIL